MWTRQKPEDKTDEQLLSGYKSGNTNDFRVLVERYRQPLASYLFRMVRDAHAVEDLFQEVFMSVHRSLATFDFSRRFRPWVYAIATNLARDEMRRRHNAALTVLDGAGDSEDGGLYTVVESLSESPEDSMGLDEQKRFIRRTVETLPEHLKTVLVLFHYQELKYREIADALEIPIGTVKSRLHAALTQISQAFERKFNRPLHEFGVKS